MASGATVLLLLLAALLPTLARASASLAGHLDDVHDDGDGLRPPSGGGGGTAALNRTSASERVLSRAKRYVLFPKGSSLQLVYDFSIHAYVPLVSGIFVIGLTQGLAWMLPSETRQIYLQRRDTDQHLDRTHRLKLYQDMGIFLNTRGLQGQHCVLRTICESTRPKEEKGNFMEELFQIFFSLPAATSYPETSDWGRARYNGTSCSARYPNCASIIDIPIQPIK